MARDVISIGSRVSVKFSTHPAVVGKVTYMPAATGDCWHVTTDSGDVIYIQQFDTMLKLSDEYPDE